MILNVLHFISKVLIMSKRYKIGQFIGIVIGVIAGSMIANAIFGQRRQDP